MKKIVLLFITSFLFLLLNSCGDLRNELIISTYLEGTLGNKCIELYNYTDNDVDLSGYQIQIFGIGDKTLHTIKLNGVLKSKDCYVIVNSNSVEELLEKADLKTSELDFGGLEAIGLVYNNNINDIIGTKGIRNTLADKTLIRKVNMATPQTTFDEYYYINYCIDEFSYLGEFVNSVTPEELLAGPCFDSKYLEEDFILKTASLSKMGAGGAVKVELEKNVDGDTSWFIFPDELNIASFVDPANVILVGGKASTKVRYQDIDTPETYTGKIMEFGWPAKLYTGNVQSNADNIYIQSVKNDSLLCTFGRIMGYVFVENGNSSLCVNYMIILKGYSVCSISKCYSLSYKGVPYYGYMQNAMLYAKRNQKGLWGEKDPYWDYDNHKSIFA